MRQLILIFGLCCIHFLSAQTPFSNLIETDSVVLVAHSGDLFTGTAISRYLFGDLRVSTQFVEGIPHGEVCEYFPGGVRKVKYELEDGELHGKYWTYYPDGSKKSLRRYQNGKLHGVCKAWSRGGYLTHLSRYKEGELHGRSLEYVGPQRLFKATAYSCGEKHGIEKVYMANGNVDVYRKYDNSFLVWERYPEYNPCAGNYQVYSSWTVSPPAPIFQTMICPSISTENTSSVDAAPQYSGCPGNAGNSVVSVSGSDFREPMATTKAGVNPEKRSIDQPKKSVNPATSTPVPTRKRGIE